MDPVVLAAIIGAVGTIAAAVITWFLTRLLDGRPRSPVIGSERRRALEGTWSGVLHQRQGPIRTIQLSAWTMKTTRRSIRGQTTIQLPHEGKTLSIPMDITGSLLNDRFFKVEYRSQYQGKEGFIQFGYGLLELSMNGHILKGAFVGIGPVSGRIIDGTVEIKKPFE